MAEPNTPHDALFKWTFSQVAHARAELRSILPAAVLERVDLESLQLCPGEFVDAALAASYSDLLYQIQIAGRPGFLYVLFEHQSSPDPVMPLRLLGYIVRILETEVRVRRDAQEPVLPLPIVLPVVLHHGAQGWTRAARLEELFDPDLMAIEQVAGQVLKIVLNEAPIAEEAMTTLAERWKAEGREEGKAEGREEGKAEGREEACRKVLEQLLVLKFGALAQGVSERIASAREDELTAWTKRVLSANTLEEVFAS